MIKIWAKIGKTGLFLMVFSLVSILSCPQNNKPVQSEALPSQIVTDFQLYESASGKKLYRLFAEKAYVFDETQKINVTKPYIVFYNENGSISSTLNAIRGQVDSKTSDLFAKDSVLVQTSDSTILKTDSLVWNNKTQTIITDAWVKIQTRQGLIEGQGLVSDAAMKKIEIKSSVTGKSHYEF
jgi:LPS export ABC transporter protein LptC